jgi:hypothetical protein
MEASLIHTRTTTQSNTDAAGMTVLKKAIEIETEPAFQLIAETNSHLPSHLGQNINTTA